MKTPKEILLELANQNPNQVIVAVEINGRITVMSGVKNLGDALLMRHYVDENVHQLVKQMSGGNLNDVQA